jgi:hypothetical protein
MSTTTVTPLREMATAARGVRAYFATVNRATGAAAGFDAAANGRFALDAPPTPWVDLGPVTGFERVSGTKIEPMLAGSPAVARGQARTALAATVRFQFESWGRLQMALAAGSQQMNVVAAGATATPVQAGSTATLVKVGSTAVAGFAVGQIVAVDVDYAAGTTGFVGSGVSAAYVTASAAAAIGGNVNYVRQVTLNTARIAAVTADSLVLAEPLLAGAPMAGMQTLRLDGFTDREGGGFFQEWSGLFVVDGEQGDRIVFYYPRLQAMQEAAETRAVMAVKPLERWGLAAALRALPVTDAVDGEQVLCYRTYLPAAGTQI